ncbi:hypothetical protein [Paenibacillus allorhizoplanae]|nr:hypothetical protein [Paenibacillus allorhizoplanae]
MPKVIIHAIDIAGDYKVGYTESTESDFQYDFGNHMIGAICV